MTQTNQPGMKIWPGRHVALELTDSSGEAERLELDVVAEAAADFARGFLGESTPLGQAILGREAGEVVYYQVGSGPSAERVRVRILEVSGTLAGQPEDLSERRAAAARKATQQVNDNNVRLFAASFSGKWGDYDPNAVGKEEDDPSEE